MLQKLEALFYEHRLVPANAKYADLVLHSAKYSDAVREAKCQRLRGCFLGRPHAGTLYSVFTAYTGSCCIF